MKLSGLVPMQALGMASRSNKLVKEEEILVIDVSQLESNILLFEYHYINVMLIRKKL